MPNLTHGGAVLIPTFVQSRSGAGADLFVLGGRCAMTFAHAPIGVPDLDPASSRPFSVDPVVLLPGVQQFGAQCLALDLPARPPQRCGDPAAPGRAKP